jgi:ribosome-associated protein
LAKGWSFSIIISKIIGKGASLLVLQNHLKVIDPHDARKVAYQAAEALAEVKGKEILIIDFDGQSSLTDYFVIATGDSPVHMRALANRVNETLTSHRLKNGRAEGQESQNWILLDYGTIVVHILSRKAREYYAIDQLWGDAKAIPWTDESGQPYWQ